MELSASEKKAALKALGQRIESLIYEKFKNKEQFLAETGFYKANLHEVITGKVDVQFSILIRLAKVLKVPVEVLAEKGYLSHTNFAVVESIGPSHISRSKQTRMERNRNCSGSCTISSRTNGRIF